MMSVIAGALMPNQIVICMPVDRRIASVGVSSEHSVAPDVGHCFCQSLSPYEN